MSRMSTYIVVLYIEKTLSLRSTRWKQYGARFGDGVPLVMSPLVLLECE